MSFCVCCLLFWVFFSWSIVFFGWIWFLLSEKNSIFTLFFGSSHWRETINACWIQPVNGRQFFPPWSFSLISTSLWQKEYFLVSFEEQQSSWGFLFLFEPVIFGISLSLVAPAWHSLTCDCFHSLYFAFCFNLVESASLQSFGQLVREYFLVFFWFLKERVLFVLINELFACMAPCSWSFYFLLHCLFEGLFMFLVDY